MLTCRRITGKQGSAGVTQALRRFLPSLREGRVLGNPKETLQLLLDLVCIPPATRHLVMQQEHTLYSVFIHGPIWDVYIFRARSMCSGGSIDKRRRKARLSAERENSVLRTNPNTDWEIKCLSSVSAER